MDDNTLLPTPFAKEEDHKDEYKKLAEMYENMLSPKEYRQIFRCTYQITSNNAINEVLHLDGIEDYRFSFTAKFSCGFQANCKNSDYQPNLSNYDCCSHGYFAEIQGIIINLGRKSNFSVTVGIEKQDLTTEPIFSFQRGQKWQFQSWNFKRPGTTPRQEDNHRENPFHGDYINQDGDLTFVCEISAPGIQDQIKILDSRESLYQSTARSLALRFSDSNINPSELIAGVWMKDGLADVILSVGKNKIFCHRLVLAMNSPIFEKLFANGTREAKCQHFPLEGTNLNTIKSLLVFMYKNALPDEEITLELLAVSDKYNVIRLKEICIEKLGNDLNNINVAHIWEAAYLHNCKGLVHKCILFMAKNWGVLLLKENIGKLVQKYPKLSCTISALLANCKID